MNCFDYPIDTKYLIRNKKCIKEQILKNASGFVTKRVAVLGGSTTNEVVDQLELFLLHYGIKADIYQSEYNQFFQDAVFSNPKLDDFAPDVVYIHTNWRNISTFPTIEDSLERVQEKFNEEKEKYETIWETIHKRFNCIVIQNNFERPDYRLMGNRDIWDYRGRTNFIIRLNHAFYDFSQSHEFLFINDLDYLAADYGLTKWNESKYWYLYKYACPINAIPYVAKSVADIIKSVYGYNKKLLALDLDNTLWGGVISEDGMQGIEIGSETPKGEIYLQFQHYCKELKQIGVILAINSKNDEEIALEGFNRAESVLQKSDFVAIKANWNSKDQNLKEIAQELSLGMDSFVFIDDNPAERMTVHENLQDVSVPNMGLPEEYIQTIDRQGYFEVTNFSAEDALKTEQYQARQCALQAKEAYKNYDSYLDDLEMYVKITDFESQYIPRIAQLTNKSNQFNLTTLRCTESEIQNMQESDRFICLCGRIRDRFSDHGITSIVVGEREDASLHIRIFLMSCRVLKRGLENAMMNALISEADKSGVKEIFAYYYPTKKNGMVSELYSQMGFTLLSQDSNGNKKWCLRVQDYEPCKVHMIVEEQ